MKKDMIVVGEDWGCLPSSTQHLIKNLPYRIIWVNSIGMRKPKLNIKDLNRAFRKIQKSLLGLLKPSSQKESRQPEKIIDSFKPFMVIQPIIIPMATSSFLRWVNAQLWGWFVKHKWHSNKLEEPSDPILWLSLPSGLDILAKYPNSPVIYYCCDDFGSLAGVDHREAEILEKELVGKSDVIFVSSEALFQKIDRIQSDIIHQHRNHYPVPTVLLPHGVDFELFSNPVSRAIDLPVGKIAGFYGSIESWLDQSLIRYMAESLPDWTFVFIGNIKTPITISDVPNVIFLGPRPHHELPHYVQHWDVGIIPFLDTPQIRASNPLKMREYLASGCEIVTTPFPAILPYLEYCDGEPLIYCAEDCKKFVESLEKAFMNVDNISRKQKRQDLVRSESWKSRSEKISDIIKGLK